MTLTLPIEIIKLEDASYHIMIQAEFSSNIIGNLIIDTGASKTVFDQQFVESFITNLEDVDQENSSGINAMITDAKIGIIPLLKFGLLEINGFNCLLIDLSHVNTLYKKFTNKQIAGLMGSDFLMEHKAVINYAKKNIKLSY